MACYSYFGLTLSTLKYCAFAFLLLGLISTDAETKLLPDKLTLPGLALGVIFSLLVPVHDLASQFLPGAVNLPFSSDVSVRLYSLLDSLLGAALGASFIYGVGAIYLRWRGMEGMGFGDVKLMAMVGAFLGMKLTVFTIFTASIAGSMFGLTTVFFVWMKRTRRFMQRLANAQAARRRGWQSAQMVYRHYQMPFGVFLGSMALVAFFVGNEFLTLVREALVKIMANPVLLRAAVVLFCAGAAFLFGLVMIRLLRKSITEEADLSAGGPPSAETLPLHVFNTVIQQLKQQKHELDVQSKAEQQRARISETFSHAVLANLSTGVLFFGTNGLVKTSNPAAKEILGFASATGMNAEDIFRGAVVTDTLTGDFAGEAHDESTCLSDEVDAVLNLGSKRRQARAEYETPAGQTRFLSVTISPVPAADGNLLGATCLINDLTELESIRRQQSLRGELGAERALELRSSLATISGYAQQLAGSRSTEMARRLAADIAEESERLERSLGGFLTQNVTDHVGTAAPGCPAEQSSAAAPASSAR